MDAVEEGADPPPLVAIVSQKSHGCVLAIGSQESSNFNNLCRGSYPKMGVGNKNGRGQIFGLALFAYTDFPLLLLPPLF